MTDASKDLGAFLQAAREQKGLTLRAVEKATGVSNPYLSQIESGRIRQPSPVVLHKLSNLYEVQYVDVLVLAGYPVPSRSSASSDLSGVAARLGPVTKKEEVALIEYLEFLRTRRRRGGKK